MSFAVPQPRVLERSNTNAYYQQPEEICCYSADAQRQYKYGDSELKYYFPPALHTSQAGSTVQTPTDLNGGFERYSQRDFKELGAQPLDFLLQSVLDRVSQVPQRSDGTPWKTLGLDPDFVTWRGIMTKIMGAPYMNDSWKLEASKYKGAIYIAESSDREAEPTYDQQARMCYWGSKFEALCNIDKHPLQCTPEELQGILAGRADAEVNTNVHYCSVFTSTLSTSSRCHKLVLAGECDCTEGVKPVQPSVGSQAGPYCPQYLELKTNRVMHPQQPDYSKKLWSFKRFKLLKVYLQSYLAGVPRVIFGMRDDAGILVSVQEFNTLDIPKFVHEDMAPQQGSYNRGRGGRGRSQYTSRPSSMWKSEVCMNFAEEFLSWLKTVVTDDDRNVTYSIIYDGGERGVPGTVKCVRRSNSEGAVLVLPAFWP